MITQLKNLLQTRFKSNYYTKVFALYSIFTMGVLISSFIIYVNIFNKNFEKEIKESNKRLLTQVQINIDKNLLEKVSSIINENFLDPYANSVPLSFFTDVDQRNAHIVLGGFRSIYNTLVNSGYIDSICLYRKRDNTTLATDEGVRYNIFSQDSKTPPSIYYHTVKSVDNLSESRIWVSPGANSNYYSDKSIITYIQSIPIYSTLKESEGYIIINIDQRKLLSEANKIYGHNEDVILIDSDGTVFAHSNSSGFTGDSILDGSLDTILNSDEGFKLGEINGKQMGITWIKSDYNNWKYISVVPVEHLNKASEAVTRVIVLSLVFFIVLSLIGLKVITSTLFSPFIKLIGKVKDYFGPTEKGGNDLNYIDNVFSYLSVKVEDMEGTIRKNQSIIKYKTIMDILYGNISSEEDIKNQCRLFDSPFEFEYFTILIIEIDRKVFSKLTAAQREFLISKADECTNKYLSERCRAISIVHPSSCISAILNIEGEKAVIPDMNELLNHLKSVLGVNFNIAIGEMTNQVSSLEGTYSSVSGYLRYSYIYDFNNVFYSDDIERYESSTGDLKTRIISQMETSLRACKEEEFMELLSEQVSSIRRNGYSLKYTQDLLNRIIEMIANVCIDQEVAEEDLTKSKLLCGFNGVFSLDECVEWIQSVVGLYLAQISKRNSSIDYEFVEKISRFISEHISEQQISLNGVADEFNISPSHLSRLFKDALNVSFSDFVLDRKLEKAAELITSCGDKNISEIAESLGYLTPAYFAKIFKQKYGMTPALYRKKFMKANTDTNNSIVQ